MEPLRILVMLEAHTVMGAVKPVFEFAREATMAGSAQVTLAPILRGVRECPLTEAIRGHGWPYIAIEEAGRFDRRVAPQLRAAVTQARPHILWTNHSKSHFLVRALALQTRARWVAFHHGYTATSRLTRIYNQFDRWSLRAAERVVTVCQAFARDLEKRGVAGERLRVQAVPIRPLGEVDRSTGAAVRGLWGIDAAERVVLSVGRLSAEKGHSQLVEAFAKLPRGGARLLLVGDGPERGALEAQRSRLGLGDSVIFAGQQNEVRPYYGAADVFVLSSHTEGSPNVLFEAMDARLPVVSTAVGGVPEIATDEVNALLVADRDPQAMAAAVVRVLNDGALRDRLAEGGEQVVRRHTPARYFESLMQIFEEVAR